MSSTRTLYFTRTPDGVLLDERVVDSGSLTKTYYYGLDRLGSVIRVTDGTGATAATYAYDPYGVQNSAEPPSSTPNPWRYASGYYDTTTHYLKFGTRYYDPSLGRWTQRDPAGRDANPYAYSSNDPVDKHDPTGLFDVYLSPDTLLAAGAIGLAIVALWVDLVVVGFVIKALLSLGIVDSTGLVLLGTYHQCLDIHVDTFFDVPYDASASTYSC